MPSEVSGALLDEVVVESSDGVDVGSEVGADEFVTGPEPVADAEVGPGTTSDVTPGLPLVSFGVVPSASLDDDSGSLEPSPPSVTCRQVAVSRHVYSSQPKLRPLAANHMERQTVFLV